MTKTKIEIDTNGMTAGQLIMAEILRDIFDGNESTGWAENITDENVGDAWDFLTEDDWLQDATEEFRSSGEETELECDWSKHYESKAVAKQLQSGTWVGWTYWYGGGKHGEPSAMEWLDDAYFLNCVEEEKVVTFRTWSLVAATSSSTKDGES